MKKKISLFIMLALWSVIILWGSLADCDTVYMILLLVWSGLIFYCISKFEERSALFAFYIAFFTFLMGRDFLENYFHYQIENFDMKVNKHAYLSMLLAIVAVWLAYVLFTKYKIVFKVGNKKNTNTVESGKTSERVFDGYLQLISKYIFWISLPFSLFSRVYIWMFVSANSYASFYTDYSELLSGNTILYMISKMELVTSTAFYIYLSTLPKKRDFKKIVIPYLVYLFLTLGSQSRGTFILGLLILFVFIIYMQGIRPDEKWFERKMLIYVAILIPFIAIGGTITNIVRFGGNIEDLNLIKAFGNFVYDQGVSSNAIKNAYLLEDQIPGDCIYTLEFLHTGIFARILGFTVYQGNTVNHALYGNSFTHALGYTVLGNAYLAGRGTGTSFIAELYYDYGYLGVFCGSMIYGYIFSRLTLKKNNSVFKRSIIFVVLSQLFWAPRGSFTGFLSQLGSPFVILVFAMTYGLSNILTVNERSRRQVKIISSENNNRKDMQSD